MLSLREHLGSVSLALPAPFALRYATGIVVLAAASAIAAHIRIPLPFSPVPITLQTGVVLVAGATLGIAGGGSSQMLYLAVGLLGAPVFAASGGLGGPTIGYLLGFVPAAMLVGWVARGGNSVDIRLRGRRPDFDHRHYLVGGNRHWCIAFPAG